MDNVILQKLKGKKQSLLEDGFEILGVFGSFARGEETKNSDVDILYDIKPIFVQKYGGFQAFSKLNEIREDLKTLLGRNVDIATIDNDSKTFKEYALRDVVSV